MVRKRKPIDPLDTGTNELSKRHAVRPERKQGGAVHIRVLDGNHIDALLWEDQISPDEHSALVGFQIDLHRASLLGPRASILEARVSGRQHELSGSEAVGRLKVAQCIAYLQANQGRDIANLVVDLCLQDRFNLSSLEHLRRGVEGLIQFRELWLRTRNDMAGDIHHA